MAEYIEREKTVELLRSLGNREYRKEKGTIQDAIKMISYQEYTPAADVAPVVHGKDLASPSLFHCSVCGCMDSDTYTCDVREYRFCPACGAKIDEKAKPDPSVATIYKCSHCGMKSPNGYFCDFCGSRRYKEEDTQ